ncbi:MAG: D-alanyl-D-alanine carboxypeptidase family protein [Lachnospira sp.]
MFNTFQKKLFLLATPLIIIIIFLNSIINCSFLCVTAKCDENPQSLKLYARYAAMIDGESKRILYGKDFNKQVPMASTTKIMTLIIALEYCDKNFNATTSSYAASMPDVQLNASKGEQFKIEDLYYSLMLKSHNDTAVIIAENVAYYYLCKLKQNDNQTYNSLNSLYDLSFINNYQFNSEFIKDLTYEQSKTLVKIFTGLMNEKAKMLGCCATNFVTPNGLDGSNENGIHSTTAYELCLIMAYCINNEDFLHITQTKEYSFQSLSKKNYTVTNANAFLDMYDNIISGKTGFTADAGYCYICAYKDQSKTLIVALLACGWPSNKTYKWKDSKTLLDYGRKFFQNTEIINATIRFYVPIKDKKNNYAIIQDSLSYTTLSSGDENFTIKYNIPEIVESTDSILEKSYICDDELILYESQPLITGTIKMKP